MPGGEGGRARALLLQEGIGFVSPGGIGPGCDVRKGRKGVDYT